MSDPNRSCYGILDLAPSATAAEIREAYLDLVKVWHPDRFSKESPRLKHKVEEKLKAINKAYETLRSGADAFQVEHQADARPTPGRDNPNLKPMCFGERWGYVNSNEKLVIPPRFARAEPFIEGLALVAEHGRYGFIDGHGEFAVYPEFSDARSFSEGLAAVVLSVQWGYVNRQGGFQIVPSFDEGRQFSDGLAAVRWRGRWGYVNTGGGFVLRPQFDDALPFTDGWAEVKIGDKWGKANQIGDVFIDGQRILLGN
jgi:curved DNA-binding protein CbpA